MLLRDTLRGKDDQIAAVQSVIRLKDPDILILQGFDYDLTGAALSAFARSLNYPHHFAILPNSGMAILSRYPVITDQVQDFSTLLWQDFAGALLPHVDGKPFPSAEALATQRLSNTGHWIVPIATPNGVFNIATFHATPPVFDGPEDRNGKRNHDEIMLWVQVLNGTLGMLSEDFVIAGDANLDPVDGDGIKVAIRTLLDHPRIQDPTPDNPDTVDWTDPVPGDLRVDYLLPSATLNITDSGVYWPSPDDPALETVMTASRHRLVWVDIAR